MPLVRNPDVLAELVDQAPAGPAGRRLRRRDRGRRRRRAHPRAGQARPQGLRPARGQRRLGRPGVRPAGQRASSCSPPTARPPSCRAAPRTPSPRASGPSSRPRLPRRRRYGRSPPQPPRRRSAPAGNVAAAVAARRAGSDRLDQPTAREYRVPRRLFTSESVTEGHPDKIADQISDSILDAMLAQDPRSRVAVETLITTGQVHIAGEVTTAGYVDIAAIVRETVLRHRLRLLAQGLRRRLLRRQRLHRRAVARHRPGRRHRLRGRAPPAPPRTRSSARAPATRA